MKRIIRTAVCLLCAAGIMLPVSGMTQGETSRRDISALQEELDSIRRENELRKEEIDSLGGDVLDNQFSIILIGSQIDGYQKEINVCRQLVDAKQTELDEKRELINGLEADIAEQESEIGSTCERIAELDAQHESTLKKFGEIARYMYMNDSLTQLSMANEADDWFDYLMYAHIANNISKQSSEVIDGINREIAEQDRLLKKLNSGLSVMETKKALLEVDKRDYERRCKELEDEKAALESELSKKQTEIFGLALKNIGLLGRIAGLKISMSTAEAQAKAIDKEITELLRQAQQERDPAMPDHSEERFGWPLDTAHDYISVGFGYDEWRDGDHSGIDISDSGIIGAPIYAAQSGRVVAVSETCAHNEPKPDWTCGCGGNYGNYIIIDHGGTLATLYAHCQAIYVKPGQYVGKGEAIGEVGSTGWSTWYHLHFEVRDNGVRVDPMNYVGQFAEARQRGTKQMIYGDKVIK